VQFNKNVQFHINTITFGWLDETDFKCDHVFLVDLQVAVQCGTESGDKKLWGAEDAGPEHENASKQEDLSALECKEIVSGRCRKYM
jgi:hypothetical protein